MNRQTALRALFWKDTRQILPLVWLQLGLGVVLQLLIMLNRQSPFTPQLLVIMGMPSLFALGVGALLVGQEKERRTMDWVRWLPVAPGDVLRVKLGVGLVSLIAVWCLNLLLLPVFVLPGQPWRPMTHQDWWIFDTGWEYLWPLQSVFLLVAGFATAWLFRSSLVSLLTLVPLALLPGAASLGLIFVVEWVSGDRLLTTVLTPWFMGGAMGALSLALLVIGWRCGVRGLAAEAYGRQRGGWRLFLFHAGDDAPTWIGPAHAPTSMLVWQFLRQNQTVLLGIVGLMLSAVILVAASGTIGARHGGGGSVVLPIPLVLLATSWLGVLAFHGDLLHQRIRFLAERGVSPGKVWATRHAVPLSLLAVLLVVVLCLLEYKPAPGVPAGLGSSPPIILLTVSAVLFIYGVSQAVGQIFPSATIAAVAAPVVAWALLAYGAFLATMVGAPYWLLALLSLLPWLATYLLMRRWMDGRLGWGFWGAHAGLLAAWVILPLVPLGLVMVSQPTMPAEVRRQLIDESRRYGTTYLEPRELVLRSRDPESEDPPPESRIVEGQLLRQRLAQDLSPDPRPIRYTPTTWPRYLLGEARLARMALEQDADSEPQRQRYRETVELIHALVWHLRLSWRLADQDGADLIEIWLVRELGRSEARQQLGGGLYTRLVRSLGNDAGRNAARRRAIVMSWAAYRAPSRSSRGTPEIGGYSWLGESASILYSASPYSRRRAADYLTWLMLQRLEKHEDWNSEPRIRELAKYWGVPELVYGVGLGGDFLRADDPAEFAVPVEGLWRRAPGGQWHAGWERLARELVEGLEGQ
jgi:hypothetical protein